MGNKVDTLHELVLHQSKIILTVARQKGIKFSTRVWSQTAKGWVSKAPTNTDKVRRALNTLDTYSAVRKGVKFDIVRFKRNATLWLTLHGSNK